jgi:hypothetical protein
MPQSSPGKWSITLGSAATHLAMDDDPCEACDVPIQVLEKMTRG